MIVTASIYKFHSFMHGVSAHALLSAQYLLSAKSQTEKANHLKGWDAKPLA
jgi:hypothetical protein